MCVIASEDLPSLVALLYIDYWKSLKVGIKRLYGARFDGSPSLALFVD